MATKKQEVSVRFLSDTKGYVQGVQEAEAAQDDLTKSIVETEDAQDDLNANSSLTVDSLGDLNQSLTQTSEGLIDSASGMSGLGAAMTSITGRVRAAAGALSTFSKALIATGIGAALAALAAIVVYWEDIKEFIKGSADELERYNIAFEESNKRAAEFDKVVRSREEIQKRNIEILNEITDIQEKLDPTSEKSIFGGGRTAEEAEALAGILTTQLNALTEEFSKLTKDYVENIAVQDAYTESTLAAAAAEADRINKLDELAAKLQEINRLQTEGAQAIYDNSTAFGENQVQLENALDRLLVFNDKLQAQNQERIDTIKNQMKLDQDLANAKVMAMSSVFNLGATLASENQQLQGAILIGEATANTAVAVTAAAKIPVTAPFMIPAIIALGLAQIATIAKAMNTNGASVSAGAVPEVPVDVQTFSGETARADTLATPQVVLVTEDLDAVQNRVTVTESRGTLA